MELEKARGFNIERQQLDYRIENQSPGVPTPENIKPIDRFSQLVEGIQELPHMTPPGYRSRKITSIDFGGNLALNVHVGYKLSRDNLPTPTTVMMIWLGNGKKLAEETVHASELQSPDLDHQQEAHRKLGLLEESLSAAQSSLSLTA